MSESAVVIADPFDAVALDEQTEMAALTNALRLADGFRLFFVRCNQPNQRLRLIAKLGLSFPQDTFFGIHLTEPVLHLLDALRERLPASPPRAVFVSGLEYSLPLANEAEHTTFIANLNAARNSFSSVIPCPLVLWLPEYALTAIARGAPDFFSIRSGVYFFAASPEETVPLIQAITAGDGWQLANFSLSEKQKRIAAIENLLQDYQTLASDRRDYQAEALLLKRLGHLYLTLGHWKRAEKVFQQSLKIFRQLGDRQGEGNTQNNLGIVYKNQGRLTEAEHVYQEGLTLEREMGDRKSEGRTLGNLGIIYSVQGHCSKAGQAFQQSLQIFRELGDRQGEGQALGNLANVYKDQGRLAEAEGIYQQSLTIKGELGDRNGEGDTLNNLGSIYQSQGRLAEAEQIYQQSLTIKRTLGDLHGEGLTLGNLALVKEAEGNITEALEIGRTAVEVLRSTEDATLLKEVREWVEKWEGQAEPLTTL